MSKRLLLIAFLLATGPGLALADESCPASAASSAIATPVPTDVITQAPLLKPAPGQAEAGVLAARLMTRFHYNAVPLDDAMSAKIFKGYFDALDGQKLFFTQADLDHFAAARTKLDDAIWNGDLSVPYAIFNLYERRAGERTQYALDLLKKGFDFNVEESYQPDRDKASWTKDTAALNDIWRKRVKNDWIRLKLAGQKDDDIRKTLGKRYASFLDRVHQLDSQDVFQTFMNAYAMAIDPHSNYFGPRASANFDIAMKLSLDGIGAVLEQRDDYTLIREIVPGGPASGSDKLAVGDKIVAVAQGACGAFTDVVGWRVDDVVDKIRGPKGTVVRLEVLPADAGQDGKHVVVSLVRKTVTIAEQAAKKSIITVKDGDTTHRIGVITLPTFYEDFDARRRGDPDYKSATRDVAKLLGELKQAKVDGVVMDVRDNGGGSLAEATELTGLFINTGPVVQVRDAQGRVEVEKDTDSGMAWSGPLAVLVNRGSASATEIFAAAMQDYGRGLIIGEQTFGKGTVQNLTDLDQLAQNEKPTFGELKMTIAEFFRINGGSTQLRGVTPDILFPHSVDFADFGESSYDNALPWTHIQPAQYRPVADLKPLVPQLTQMHGARSAKDPSWQLMLSEMAAAQKLADEKTISLDYARRDAERKQLDAQDAQFKARREALGDRSAINIHPDDGLQPGERSLQSDLASEKAAKNALDPELDETAHILADEVDLIRGNTKLAAEVLPYHGVLNGVADTN
ncbi:MAG: carboxy terminal-processing peptidase [Proteobacteria bacterium]|nr:carboxy terminal-processing peptidase [Pseudomonadota bacterium]